MPSFSTTPPLRTFLDAVDEEMAMTLAEAAKLQRVAVPEMAWRGGKRIRPRLVYEYSRALDCEPRKAVTLAAVAELIHAASLCHDDVVDNATVRRGAPSLRAEEGDRTAVLVGDLIFSAAWSRAARKLPSEVTALLASAMTRMAGAEIKEDELHWNPDAEWGSCLRIIDGKTAALFASSAGGVAVLAGASGEAVAAIEGLGQAIGRAFQILDDVQDYVPLQRGWGKEELKDLREGIVTLPLVVALSRDRGPAASDLRRYLETRGDIALDPTSVFTLFDQTQSLSICLRLARRLCHQALTAVREYAQTDELHRMVGSLLAGLQDTPGNQTSFGVMRRIANKVPCSPMSA